ncbi:PepSY domain-containing protein [Xanthomonas fragariae]|uniref:Peptidase propeptide and ypeb domain-containing protein n=1 Tax=Xanthomonas fragariae TaxID=48664 RepID=A0A1Y6HDD3_9XANT|nr:PepSY domain-containing protein [Xanthomonas fragariae]AOD13448.1 peptidase propeptide and ypeb domain-containing protein [Xanthomonas fragariae]AOD16836.1 peptidase propeptide and ypeb domain-containing protein [Xanthomonas fragariae]ENZ96717.1 peptidase propeptide and ypeb domain-containing protein [Xanthomonas fragariae LMG 25863]MBL9198409.1 PepSY domain-containing protein [Xanthomonas fragariae]MBL9221856.1 PepSY domain-containing protein [Xanthomonas fragariae]
MTQRLLKTALIGALALASHGAFAQAAADKPAKALTSAEVASMLTAKGYTKVHDVKFKHGVWTADARSGDGKNVDVRIDPVTGRVYGDHTTSKLNEADIRAALSTNGYLNVHDLAFENGLWKAEAKRGGQKVDLQLDPEDGHVVSVDNN